MHVNGTQAVSMRKHLELNRKDKDSKFRLILVESRIHRLARYYRVCIYTLCSATFVQLLYYQRQNLHMRGICMHAIIASNTC